MADMAMAETRTGMVEAADIPALLRLITWLSPAFPIGAFSYSSGLEQAVQDGLIKHVVDLAGWLEMMIGNGSGWNDAVLLAEAYHSMGDPQRLAAVCDLAQALAGSSERLRETLLQGEAFLDAARPWPQAALVPLTGAIAYPVAVGAMAAAHRTGLEPAPAAYLHAAVSNFVSVAIRCGVTGQKKGVGVILRLEQKIAETARRASISSLEDLGSATVIADISALRHETLQSRLFRS